MRLNQASSGPREIRMWGQGSQRSRLSGLRVGTGGPFDGLRPDGSIRQPPGAAASEPATPTAPGSCLPSSPHLPHPLGPAPALPDRDCRPLGSCPLGLALRGAGRAGGSQGPSSSHPTCPDSPLLYGSPPGLTLWKEVGVPTGPALLQPRGQQGKEKRAEHFMAIINQRGKSEQEK